MRRVNCDFSWPSACRIPHSRNIHGERRAQPLRAIVAALPLPALVVDADGVALAANTAAASCSSDELAHCIRRSRRRCARQRQPRRSAIICARPKLIRELTLDNLTPPAVCVLSRVRAGDGASFICTLRGARPQRRRLRRRPAARRRRPLHRPSPPPSSRPLPPAAAAPPSPPSPFGTAPSPGYPTRARAAPPPAECYADLAPPPPITTASGAGGLRPACTLIVAQRCANSASHALLAALRKQGYSVVPVDRGAAALERLRTRRQAARDCRAHPADGGSADGLQLLLAGSAASDMSAAELLRAINAEALHIPVVVLVPRSGARRGGGGAARPRRRLLPAAPASRGRAGVALAARAAARGARLLRRGRPGRRAARAARRVLGALQVVGGRRGWASCGPAAVVIACLRKKS